KSRELAARFGFAEIIRISPDGRAATLLSEQRGELRCSVNGVTWHDDKLYIAELGRIYEYDLASGANRLVLDDLPWGLHYVNKVAFGADGKAYFGIGTVTNSGVVSAADGCCWSLRDFPDKRDLLPFDATLAGVNFSGPY